MSETRCTSCDRTYVGFKLSTGETLHGGVCLRCSVEKEKREKEENEFITLIRDGVFIREKKQPAVKIIHTPKIVRDITEALEQLTARKEEAIRLEQYEVAQAIKETEEDFIKSLNERLKALD